MFNQVMDSAERVNKQLINERDELADGVEAYEINDENGHEELSLGGDIHSPQSLFGDQRQQHIPDLTDEHARMDGYYQEQYQNVQSDLDEVKKRLREVFNYYSSFGDRLNMNNLKSSKFHKMMQDALIINSTSTLMEKKRLDIIFCQVNKHKPNMNFESFL